MTKNASRPTAIVVDDEHDMAEVFADAAEIAGYDAAIVTSSVTLLDLLRDRPVDVILLDIVMPDMDGFELLRELAAMRCPSRIFLMSGYSDSYLQTGNVLGAAYGLEIVGTMRKPLSISEITHLLTSAMPSDADDGGCHVVN